MSVARNSHALRRWQRLSSQLRPSRPFSIYPARLAHTTTATNTNTTTTTPPPKTTRQFHSSPSLDAARSPAARRAQASRVRQPTVSRETPLPPAQGSSDARREFLDANGENLWAEAVKAHVIDEKVDLDTFMRISHELFKRAYTGSPSAQAIWEIDLDADLVYNIGHIASIGEPRFKEWLLTSCALAEARMPTLVCATRYLTQYNSKVKSEPPRTPLLDKVESLALHHRDPIAMTLHAQALGLRGRHNDAIPLIEEVMGAIKPDSNPPTLVNGGFLGGFPLPWDVYEWLKREVGDRDAAMEAVKLAALEYHEPSALVKYANHVLAEKGDLELYEECMSKAASAGHPEACRKLANFYLLTSVGRYPRRGEASAKQPLQANGSGPKRSWLSSLFNRSLSLPDYGKLARGWYRVACLHGSRKAALTFSLLLREKGDYQTGKLYLEMAAMEPELLPAIRGYRVNWDNQELSLVVDYAKLEV